MSQPKLKMVRHDTKPDLVFQILYAEGPNKDEPFDLAGCTVNFHLLENMSDTALKNAGHTECNLTDETNGLGKYTWASDDLDTAGRYHGELQITFVDTTQQTIEDEIPINVRKDYDNA
jgi:hypothetical protein